MGVALEGRENDAACERECVLWAMTETVTITHHLQKPEYHWEISIEDQPAVMLQADGLEEALRLLGVSSNRETVEQIQQLPNGESRAVQAELASKQLAELRALSVK